MRKVTIGFVMSVSLFVRPSVCLSAWKNWVPTGRILMKSGMSICRKSAVYEIMWKNMIKPDRPQVTM